MGAFWTSLKEHLMKAVVFHGIGDIRLDNVPEPRLERPDDAIVRLTSSAICGTDLHMVRGTLSDMQPGTILGHEGVGVVEEIGAHVRNLRKGERVVIPSTIGCGYCSYCRAGYYAQCDHANPNGPLAGTAFFGGPKGSGPFQGLQAEYARIPYAQVGPVILPDSISDNQAILLSDIFPTGYFGAKLAAVKGGDVVAVFGCGPVGQFTIASCKLLNAGRIFAIDKVPSRLEMAQRQGAEVINFNDEDPVAVLRDMTGGIGPECVIDAVGIDAEVASGGPAHEHGKGREAMLAKELQEIAPHMHPVDGNWHPGSGPSQALHWAVESVAKAGRVAIIGVYPPADRFFPIGLAMNKNLRLTMGNCHHRAYLPELIQLVRTGAIDPSAVLTQQRELVGALDAYKAFDKRTDGWMKVGLKLAS